MDQDSQRIALPRLTQNVCFLRQFAVCPDPSAEYPHFPCHHRILSSPAARYKVNVLESIIPTSHGDLYTTIGYYFTEASPQFDVREDPGVAGGHIQTGRSIAAAGHTKLSVISLRMSTIL